MNCGSRLQEAGHNVTFLLPSESLIIEDCKKIAGAKVGALAMALVMTLALALALALPLTLCADNPSPKP